MSPQSYLKKKVTTLSLKYQSDHELRLVHRHPAACRTKAKFFTKFSAIGCSLPPSLLQQSNPIPTLMVWSPRITSHSLNTPRSFAFSVLCTGCSLSPEPRLPQLYNLEILHILQNPAQRLPALPHALAPCTCPCHS